MFTVQSLPSTLKFTTLRALALFSFLTLLVNSLFPVQYAWTEEAPKAEAAGDAKQPEAAGTAAEKVPSKQQKAGERILDRITVVGSDESANPVPGSAYLLTGEKLEEAKGGYDDIHRILRDVPGVNIQEEDGYGLRPNIGFRGTSTERSDAITLMEDGVLIAPAPYSAPAAYYFPTPGRMEGIEILKGASQIKYGPRTIGGSLNLLSTSIPEELTLKGQVATGSDSTKKIHLAGGESYRYGGFLLETYQAETNGFKELDGGGDTGYELEDYVGKFRLNTDPDSDYYQQLEFKIGDYDQDSNETYLGLSQEDFDRNPYRRYSASQLDNITVDHRQYQLRHYVELAESLDLTTTGYYNGTDRAWYKLESAGGKGLSAVLEDTATFAEQYSWLTGESSPDGALVIRNNNREYYSRGIQSVVAWEGEVGGMAHKVEAGARFHEDEEDRFQQDDGYRMDDGTMVLTTPGAPGSQTNRVGSGEAWAFYVQDAIGVGDVTITPGLRYETIDYTLEDYGKKDPNRIGTELKRTDTEVSAVIPGVGVNYQVTEEAAAFFGIHKGFSPPGPVADDNIDEEESVNYELGANYKVDAFRSELVFFYNDYENLLGADTLSSGGTGSGDLFNAGEAQVWGLEASLGYDFGKALAAPVGIPWNVAYTYTDAEFDSSFSSSFFGEVSKGDSIPYIPDNQLSTSVGVTHEAWGSLLFRSHYVNAMPTAAGDASLTGGPKTDSYFVFDAKVETPVTKEASLFVDFLNIFDEDYVVARRPAGARPGLPFTFLAGIKLDL